MVNLFDIMKQAQSGAGFSNLSHQYGLTLPQTQLAVEALLPAFTLAFRHAAQNPEAFGALVEMVSSSRYLPFFEGNGANLADSSRSGAGEILQKLFGSDEVSRRVADQASAVTGIGTGVLHRMLPTVAAVIMGGLVRSASVEGLSDILRTWSDALRAMKAPERPAPVGGGDLAGLYRHWGEFATLLTGGKPAPTPDMSRRVAAADPWTAMWQTMLGGAKPPPPPPPPSQPNPFETLFQMFETGREVQAQHLANLQSVLGGVWGGTPAR